MNDTLTYDNSGGLQMVVDLTEATIRTRRARKAKPRTKTEPLTAEEVATLRALTEALHAVGDEHVRTQFASGAEQIVACLGGQTVTVVHESDGRAGRPELEAIGAWVRERLNPRR